jgi:hypothetical protein
VKNTRCFNGLSWQTHLSALSVFKRLFSAVANSRLAWRGKAKVPQKIWSHEKSIGVREKWCGNEKYN